MVQSNTFDTIEKWYFLGIWAVCPSISNSYWGLTMSHGSCPQEILSFQQEMDQVYK